MLNSVMVILSGVFDFLTTPRFIFGFAIGSIAIIVFTFIWYLFKTIVIDTFTDNLKKSKIVVYMNNFWSKRFDDLGLREGSSNPVKWKKILFILLGILLAIIIVSLVYDLVFMWSS